MLNPHIPFYRRYLRLGLFLILIPNLIIVLHLFLDYWSPDCLHLCPYTSKLTADRVVFDQSYFVHRYSEFVCPQTFRNLADWVYGWPNNVFEERIETTTRQLAPCLPSGSIIYVKTDYLDKFFSEVYPSLINKFVLITGQGDASSPGRHLTDLEHNDSKIIHWFGQNSQIDASRSNKFTLLPIGINCYEMADAIRGVHRQHANDTFLSSFQENGKPLRYIQPLDITLKVLNKHHYEQLLLLNFRPDTDGSGIRARIWKAFCNGNSTYKFSTCIEKPFGVDRSILPTVYTRNRHYPFWFSPRGNGLDCHRTWEALYLDVIPIVWNSTLNVLYKNLPVVIINDWSEINEQFLRHKLHEIAAKKATSPSDYQFEKLTHLFWQHVILNKSRHSPTATTRKGRCWSARITT